ncbi:hypothetical protein O181_127066 [Austropuccinia psidii MF-1]|uniref:DUF4219 domain-containing protein n=1 Tax=Austropuccinia psidii MF-1 TaxID=1389203 RepID=A0A9Q3KWA9_9BASI|nr:hypothetical protein [Austropuccinia psidii MF-1]
MNTNEQNNDLQKIIPLLTDGDYLEWKLQMIICLKHRRIYQYCIEQCIPGNGVTRTPTVKAKIINANVEACGLITNFLDSINLSALVTSEETTQNRYLLWKTVNKRFVSSTFNSKAKIWSKFKKLTSDDSLKYFIANTRKCLSDMASVVTLNADTQGNPDAIINVLNEATLKEDALLIDTTRALVLKRIVFHQKLFTTVAMENIIHLSPRMELKNAGNYTLK